MFRTLLLAAAAGLALASCDSAEKAAVNSPAEQPPVVQSQKDIDPEAYHNNIQSAIAEIPSSIREDFQKLFICEVRRNNQKPNPKPVDAAYIRALADYLKSNPGAASSCTA